MAFLFKCYKRGNLYRWKGQQEEEKSKEMESNLSRNDAGLEFAFNDPPLLSHYRQFSAEEEKKIYGFLSVSF